MDEIVRNAAAVQQRFLVVLPREMNDFSGSSVLVGERNEARIGGETELNDDVGGVDAEMREKLLAVELEGCGGQFAGQGSTGDRESVAYLM